MKSQLATLFLHLTCVSGQYVDHSEPHKRQSDVLEPDVVIIGGGATGAYAAVRLREDFNKTVLVIEKENRLGGHVHTLYPSTGRPVNYGVQAYLDRPNTAAFFSRFGMELINPEFGDYVDLIINTEIVDFSTGLQVDYPSTLDLIQVPLDLTSYYSLCLQYESYFADGYFRGDDIPEDLLMPFGEFLAKYDLEASLAVLRNLLWVSDPLTTPTFFIMAIAGKPQIGAFGYNILGDDFASFKWPSTYSSETVFDRALELMRDDVLLGSTVSSSTRSDDGVELVVSTPDGERTVRAKKMLITAVPTTENTAAWDLSTEESQLFSKFTWGSLYVGVVGETGLPDDVPGLRNTPDDAAGLYLPQGSFADAFTRSGDEDIFTTRVIGSANLTSEEAQAMVFAGLNAVDIAGTFDIADNPSLLAWASHGPGQSYVSAEELKDGFWTKMYALQGQRSTFWTGLAWAPDYTPILWDFTEGLFEQIIQGL